MRAAELKRIAIDAGASGVGICGAEPFRETERAMRRRHDDGFAADLGFTYTDPVVATDVGSSFAWARSLVVVASSYLPAAGAPGEPAPRSGRIARFATRDHYEPLRAVLDRVVAALTAAEFEAEALVDDRRLVDRAAAVRAGVGWWGKNTMVLVPGPGPWVLLGSVVTDAVLERDIPMARGCGTCAACLPACPTGALVEPGMLDARRCLAHVLQAPGLIPRELRAAIGDRIYGCDDCLEACPPGRRIVDASRVTRGRVDLAELLSADDATLLERFGHHYIPGRNPRYLRRNALVALGNTGGSDAEAIAIGYLGHPDPMLRIHAAWATGELGGRFTAAALDMAASVERDPAVRREIEMVRSGI